MFCPKCSSLLRPKTEGSRKIMYCSCGYKTKDKEKVKIKEKIKTSKDAVTEVVTSDETETLPTTKVECPECKNKEAHYWLVQTRAGDEPETKFLRCIKCKHTWRDYD